MSYKKYCIKFQNSDWAAQTSNIEKNDHNDHSGGSRWEGGCSSWDSWTKSQKKTLNPKIPIKFCVFSDLFRIF